MRANLVDSMTHIHFAANLLRVAGRNFSAVECALFPQIDRKPAYYHRLYAHSIPRAAQLAAAAQDVYWESDVGYDGDDYLRKRLTDDRSRIRGYLEASEIPLLSGSKPEDREIILAIISHIYNDQFNNPVQAFVPYNVYPSGAWSLWSSIDSGDFRWYLYEKNAIDAFREELFHGDEWNIRAPVEALGAAMTVRLAKACPSEPSLEVVEQTLGSVGLTDAYRTQEYDEASAMLEEHDRRLCDLVRKYSAPRLIEGPRYWAGYGY